jgi:CysZ protein
VSSQQRYNPRAANPLYHFTKGLRFFFAGLPLLFRHPALLGLSLIPVLLTLVLLGALSVGGAWLAGDLLADTFGAQWRVFAQAVIVVLALVLGYFLYLPLARVLLAPFSEALSRRTHLLTTGARYGSQLHWARAMWEGLKLVSLQLTLLLTVFIIGIFLPPIGAPLGILVAVFVCGLDFLDVPLSARGLPLRKKLGVIWQHKALALGFGLAAYLMLFIPFINLLALPVGVIGATLLTDQLDRD